MNCMDNVKLNIINKVRMLWMQHSEWTQMAFISVIFDNPNKKATINRLLENPVDFANFLKNFYGDATAFEFCRLLTEHLQLAVQLVELTKIGDIEKANIVNERLHKNAEEISALLTFINPYWHYQCWRNMFYIHLSLASQMALQNINGNYVESINSYDKFEAEVIMMANIMAEGILKQFF